MRTWFLVVTLALALAACDDASVRDPRPPIAQTGEMVEVSEESLAVIAAQHVDVALEQIVLDRRLRSECGEPFRRLHAEADFAGADVQLGLRVGECLEDDTNTYYCEEPPADIRGDTVELLRCDRLELEDGRVVDSGIDVAYQEGRYRVAVMHGDGIEFHVSTRTDEPSPIGLGALVAIASDPAIGARVDSAYVDAVDEVPISTGP